MRANTEQRMERRGRRLSAWAMAVLVLLGAEAREAAAVSVSPLAVYLDARTRTATLNLHNPGLLPEEVEISFAYGYPTSDATGRMSLQLYDELPEGALSAAGWLRAFPRRMILQPGQRQVVRVMIEPPPGLAEGEYWARVLVRSRGGQPPIEQTDGQVAIQINVETVMAVALSFRQGAVQTGVEIAGASFLREEDRLVATLDLERLGNAAYLGRVVADLLDAGGAVVESVEEQLAVYHGLRRRISFQLPADRAGPFRVRLRLDTERDDLPRGGPLPFRPVSLVMLEGETR